MARREHSRVELNQKLSKKGFAQDQIGRALEQLLARDLQSDQRFVEDFVRSRTLKGNGPLRIVQELKMRGIDDGLFNAWIDTQPIDWFEIACHTYSKKYGSSEARDMREKAKRMRYMQSKGFPGDIIRRVMK